MAKLSSTFSSLPRNDAARRRLYRAARLGQRPNQDVPPTADALHVITAAQRYKEAFVREQANISFLQVLADAWAARKDWRP